MPAHIVDRAAVKGFDRRFLDRPHHPLGLTIGPRMIWFCQPVPFSRSAGVQGLQLRFLMTPRRYELTDREWTIISRLAVKQASGRTAFG